MKSILLLNSKYLNKRRRVFALVGLSLMLTVLLLSIALSMLQLIERPFDIAFDGQKSSEILLLFDVRNTNEKELSQWFLKQDEVLAVSEPSPYIMIDAPLIHGQQEIDVSLQLTEYNSGHFVQDEIRILKGEIVKYPNQGEIWLPSHFERSFGLQLGDILGLNIKGELRELKVTAFVVDPHYLSAIFNPSRAWVAPGELPFLAPLSELNTNMLGVRLRDRNKLDEFWKYFNESFDYSGKSLQYPLFKRAFTSVYNLLGSVLLIFSIMGLLISLLVIRHTISSHIYSDVKQIGVLKGVGFTPKNIMFLYLTQISVLALVTLPLGLSISWFTVQEIVKWMLEPIGVAKLSYDLNGPMLLSFGIVLFLVLAVSFSSARKAGGVKPVEAIRNSSQKRGKFIKNTSKIFSSQWLPLPILLGGRFLSSRKDNLLLMLISMAAIVIVITFCVNISNSFDKIHTDRVSWGFDNVDVIINRKNTVLLPLRNDQLLRMLGEYDDEIQAIMPYNHTNLFILSSKNKAVKEIQGKVYFESLEKTGLGNVMGKHPGNADEISLCVGTAKEFGKKVGDTIAVFIEGQKKVFSITGIYQDVGNLGQGFRLQEEALLELNPLFEAHFYGIQLRSHVDRNAFRSKLENQLGETIQTELSVEERKSMISMIMNVRVAVLTISIFFFLVLVLIIYNNQNIYIQQNKISFIKLKSLGFTTRNLRMVLMWKAILNLGLGVFIGIPISLWLSPKLMNILTADIGLVRFPFIPYPLGMVIVIFFLFMVGGMASWFAASALRKIDFRMITNI